MTHKRKKSGGGEEKPVTVHAAYLFRMAEASIVHSGRKKV